jgi:hypothetical protein
LEARVENVLLLARPCKINNVQSASWPCPKLPSPYASWPRRHDVCKLLGMDELLRYKRDASIQSYVQYAGVWVSVWVDAIIFRCSRLESFVIWQCMQSEQKISLTMQMQRLSTANLCGRPHDITLSYMTLVARLILGSNRIYKYIRIQNKPV